MYYGMLLNDLAKLRLAELIAEAAHDRLVQEALRSQPAQARMAVVELLSSRLRSVRAIARRLRVSDFSSRRPTETQLTR